MLAESYRTCIGRRLAAFAWRPITCDTPSVVSGLREVRLEFSGAASLFFEGGDEIMLSWKSGPGGDCHLSLARLSDWHPFSLDLVHGSGEGIWGQLVGARLAAALLFGDSVSSGEIVAARHVFDIGGSHLDLWIGVGRDNRMHESDDLVICVGSAPVNADDLELRASLALD